MSFDDLTLDQLRQRQGKKWHTFGPDILPAWVADMDFAVAPTIQRRLRRAFETGDLGYPHDDQPRRLVELLVERCRNRFHWRIDPARVELIVDVVQGVKIGLELFSRPGEGAAILSPIYPPFLQATRAMGRRAVCHALVETGGTYQIDWQGLESSPDNDSRVLLFCNPHNPTGRVFSHSELARLGELVRRRDWIVVSDEIHCDLVFDRRQHVPFASLGPEIEARTVTLLSASKTFNIAGLRGAMMVFGSEALHEAYRRGPRRTRGAMSSLGMHATEAAWTEGDGWLADLLSYLEGNRELIRGFLSEHLPAVRCHPPQATYLAWLDCRELGLGSALWQTVLDKGKLALNDGGEFGPGGEEHLRLNFATSREILNEALRRLCRALAP